MTANAGSLLCPSRSDAASAGSIVANASVNLLASHAETLSPSAISVSSGFSHLPLFPEAKRTAGRACTSIAAKNAAGVHLALYTTLYGQGG